MQRPSSDRSRDEEAALISDDLSDQGKLLNVILITLLRPSLSYVS